MRTATITYGTETIKPVDKRKTDYCAAKKLADVLGGLPSNVLVDRIAFNSDVKPVEGAFWTSQILAYPERGGVFINGDFVDQQTKWVIPASCIPPDIVGVGGMGLLIVPETIVKEGARTIVHAPPERVSVIHPFLQKSEFWGKVQPQTGMPTDDPDCEMELPAISTRFFWRVDVQAIRPVVRDFDNPYDIIAGCTPDRSFAVCYAATIREKGETLPASEGSFVMLRNTVQGREARPGELAEMVCGCKRELEVLPGRTGFRLPAITEFVNRLRLLDNRLAIKDMAPEAARELLAAARRECVAVEASISGTDAAAAIRRIIGFSEVE